MVVITGHATADQIDRVRALGAVDIIQKPAALTNYHRAIERLQSPKTASDAEPRVTQQL